MKFYRLKHVPTGLYYCPLRSIRVGDKRVKSNLSKKGKVYQSDPRKHIRWVENHISKKTETPQEGDLVLEEIK